MGSKTEAEKFLKEFMVKMEVFGILFYNDRGKNQQTFHDLEITPVKRKEIIAALQPEDYVDGPLQEKMRGILPMWIFGKKVKKKEVTIKISMGVENSQVICISFHYAEHPLNYLFKKSVNEKSIYRPGNEYS